MEEKRFPPDFSTKNLIKERKEETEGDGATDRPENNLGEGNTKVGKKNIFPSDFRNKNLRK